MKLLLKAILMLLLWGSHALASYPAEKELQRWSVLPANGATNVPLNTRIFVEYVGGSRVGICDEYEKVEVQTKEIELRSTEGQTVAATVRLFAAEQSVGNDQRQLVEVEPLSPLQPHMTYELLDHVKAYQCSGKYCAHCYSAESMVFSTFTTGDDSDDDGPVFAGLIDAGPLKFDHEAEEYSDLFSFTEAYLTLRFDTAKDDRSDPLYNLYRVTPQGDHELMLYAWSGEKAAEGLLTVGHFCDVVGYVMWHTRLELSLGAGKHNLVLKAMDHAGNEDTNDVQVLANLHCNEPTRTLPPNPNRPDPEATHISKNQPSGEQDGEVSLINSGGCTLSGAQDMPLFLMLLVVGMLVVMRRKRG